MNYILTEIIMEKGQKKTLNKEFFFGRRKNLVRPSLLNQTLPTNHIAGTEP